MSATFNPYWDAVKKFVKPGRWSGIPTIGDLLDMGRLLNDPEFPHRYALNLMYCFTVTDPETVSFVADHAGPKAVDVMAGSGYWARLLADRGVDILAFDKYPPGSGKNAWHGTAYFKVEEQDAIVSAAKHPDRTMILSWPPYRDLIGNEAVRAYKGKRIIYIGEGEGGCCGTDGMFVFLRKYFVRTREHTPVQWDGIHDYVTVWDRKWPAR